MKNIFKVVLLSGGIVVNCYAQQNTGNGGWKIAPIHMSSRWTKDVTPSNTLMEYPRPQLMRKNWQNLNGLWEYSITRKDTSAPIKFDGKILVPYPIESALSGVQKSLMPDQNLWYRRSIHKPALVDGERLLLHFGAVDWKATVYINGKEVGQHSGGYTNFTFDITDFLENDTNELLVKIFDPTDQGPNPHGKQTLNPQNIYYTASSGIWQTVWTERVPATYISGILGSCNINKEFYNLMLDVKGDTNGILAEVTILMNGNVVKKSIGPANSFFAIRLKNARLWSPDDPFLYDLKVKLLKGTKIVDDVNSYFGMRKMAIQKDEKGIDRIFLNNKYTYNLGVLDQGFWPDGLYTAPTDEAMFFDIKAIKSMGFNTIRKHLKIEPDRWYYYADKAGLLVWQDFVNPPHDLPEGAKAEFEKEIQETIDQLHNHPSIVSWVLFNERWGAYDQQRLAEWVKDYDSTRLVNGHSGELLYTNEQLRAPSDNPYIGSDVTDVHSYPDPMNPPPQPGKVKVLGEFGGIGVSIPGHEWNDLKGWGYIEVSPIEFAGKYEIMMKRLKKLELQGLSGSIYTQPFDVEGEENGLLTYDRKVVKIPLKRLREINGLLIEQRSRLELNTKFSIGQDADVNDTDERYLEFLKQFDNGRKDSIFLRRLTLIAIRKKDQDRATKIGNDYISKLKDVYSKDNLTFIRFITRTSRDKGFDLFRKESERVDKVLNRGVAEKKVKEIIYAEEIEPELIGEIPPDWDAIQKRVVAKYGNLGEEYVLGRRMVYYWTVTKDWKNMGKYYVLYFEKAVTRSDWNINNASWDIFRYVDDPNVLEFAARISKYNFDNYDNTPEAADTYANILYKLNRTKEAIEWEESAIRMSNNNKIYTETLEKMRKGEITWSTIEITN